MSSKRSGVVFLLTILMHLITVAGLSCYGFLSGNSIALSFEVQVVISELLILVPALLVALPATDKEHICDIFGVRKIRIPTFLFAILLAFTIMPIGSFLNALSMLAVDNVVLSASASYMQNPFWETFLVVAVVGPLVEELVFRGVIFSGFRHCGSIIRCTLLSALVFGCVHLNLNQFAYAFGLAIMFGLVREATGSIWPSFIVHLIFNGESVCIMYLERWLLGEEQMNAVVDSVNSAQRTDVILSLLPFYSALAIAGVALSLVIINQMGKLQGKPDYLKTIWKHRKDKWESVFSLPFLFGMLLSIAYIVSNVLLEYGIISY